MSKSVERMINRIYDLVFKKIYSKQRTSALSNGNHQPVVEAVSMLESSKQYNQFAAKFAVELAKKGLSQRRGIWRKYYEAAKKLHYVGLPSTFSAYEQQQMTLAITHNFTMIKSIPQHVLSISQHQYTSTLIEEVAKGAIPRGSFYRELASHGAKNARLIARTETAKLQTAIDENRATSLGSVAYFWLASNDKRTRPSHKAMNGVIVFWRPETQKPLLDKMRGNAGEFPNCRCATLPILDESDIEKTNYKVYDYRSDTIITMNKQDIIQALLNKGLD